MICFILNILSQMYVTYKYSLNTNLTMNLVKFSPKVSNSSYYDQYYYDVGIMIRAQFSNIFLSNLEYLYPRDIVQIRTESNSCVLSQSEASSMFPNIQTTCSNTLKNSESTAIYSIGGNGFVFVSQDDRDLNGEVSSVSSSGFSFSSNSTTDTSKIASLRANKWIDAQTKSIYSKMTYLHKFTVYIILYPIYEIILDDAIVSVSAHYVTPLFQTTSQIIYTIMTLISSIVLAVYMVIDLKKTASDYEELMEIIKENIKAEIMREQEISGQPSINQEEEKLDEDEDRDIEKELEHKINKHIGCCKRFWLRFRLPNIFEWGFIAFICFLWIQIILKLALNNEFEKISYTQNNALSLGKLEMFQYIINFIDIFLLLMLSFLFMYFINNLIPPVNFLMNHLMNYMRKYIIPAFILILISCLLAAISMTIIYGMFVYGYSNFFQSLLVFFTLLLRGSVMYSHEFHNYTENYNVLKDRIGFYTIFVFVILSHFFIRYFIVNISIASLFDEYKAIKQERKEKADSKYGR